MEAAVDLTHESYRGTQAVSARQARMGRVRSAAAGNGADWDAGADAVEVKMTDIQRTQWDIDGSAKITPAQIRMFNAICGCLADQVRWHGNRMNKDDWRHMISGTMLGWRMMPGIDRGEGAPGFIMLGGSSLKLSRTMARDAITCGLHIGDHPDEQGLTQAPVVWSDVIYRALGFDPRDFREAE